MKILVVNCGSSSIKYQLFEMPQRDGLGQGARRADWRGRLGAQPHVSRSHRAPADGDCHARTGAGVGPARIDRRSRETAGPDRRDRGGRPSRRPRRRRVYGLGADHRPGAGDDRARGAPGPVAQSAEPGRHPRRPAGPASRRPSGLFRHRVSHDLAARRLYLRLALHAVRTVPDSPLRLSRHLAPLRLRPRGPTAGRCAGMPSI